MSGNKLVIYALHLRITVGDLQNMPTIRAEAGRDIFSERYGSVAVN
jgi:hypothetical protein